MNIAILIYDQVELVDMNGPVDVFLHANRYNGSKYNVYTVAETTDPVKSEGGVVLITPLYSFENCPEPDLIVIPGLISDTYEADPAVVNWVKEMGARQIRIMSVCVGVYTLAKTGLLQGKQATTHYLALESIEKMYPGTTFIRNMRFVEDGQFITTGGITSGIDGALHLVEQLDGPTIAQQTSDVMVYNRDAELPPYTLLPPYNNMN